MSRPESEHPTELELDILKVLWDESPLLVRNVRERLAKDIGRTLAHSSVITMLNIMFDKGYLRRRKEGKSFLFWPKVQREDISSSMTSGLIKKMFDGSPSALVLSLLETSDLDTAELNEIRKLIIRKSKEQP